MKTKRVAQLSFAGGVLSEPLFSRADLTKYSIGLAKCKNFIIRPQGSVENRAGTEYVDTLVGAGWDNVRSIPFVFSNEQAYALVFVNGQVHFFLEGARLLDSSNNPFILNIPQINGPVISEFDYAQSADVLIIVHQSFPPLMIYRTGNPAAPFAWQTITFGASVSPPSTVSGVAQNGGTEPRTYAVTCLSPDGIEESVLSPSVTVNTNWTGGGTDKVRLQWQAPAGVTQCKVYKLSEGTFGLIGVADVRYASEYPWLTAPNNFAFEDDLDLYAETKITPPIDPMWFQNTGDYPKSVCFYNQRLVFGGTNNEPQTLFFSKPAAPFNFNYHVPSSDSDSIKATIASTNQNEIRFLVPTSDLLVLTDSAQWKVSTFGDNPLTPETISIRPQGQDGSARIKPLITGNSILFIDRTRGRVLRSEYDIAQNVYKARDISILAYQLFKGRKIIQMAHLPDDTSTIWFLMDDGDCVVCTFLPHQNLFAFSEVSFKYDSGGGESGYVKSITHIPDNDGERIYLVIERRNPVLNTVDTYVERLAIRSNELTDGRYLDSHLVYEGPPTNSISGLNHLAGYTVGVVADGSVEMHLTVSLSGTLTLPYEAERIVIGIPYESKLKTLPIYSQNLAGLGVGALKNVSRVFVKTYQSKLVYVYAGSGNVLGYTAPQNPSNVLGNAVPLSNDVLSVTVPSTFDDDGQIEILQKYPLPTTILSLGIEYAAGGG